MNQHPLEMDFGNISIIFKKICDAIGNCGFLIKCQMNSDGSIKTWQTLQFSLRDGDDTHSNGNALRLQTQPVIGAVQYEGSNNFSKKAPHIVNWRFYRDNLPKGWKLELERIDNEFRRDKNDGPRVNPEAQSIAYKFMNNDERTNRFIDELVNQLAVLKKSYPEY